MAKVGKIGLDVFCGQMRGNLDFFCRPALAVGTVLPHLPSFAGRFHRQFAAINIVCHFLHDTDFDVESIKIMGHECNHEGQVVKGLGVTFFKSQFEIPLF